MKITRRFGLMAALAMLAAPLAAQETTAPIAVKDFALGPADAKVQIVEYTSFTCPHCADFHENTFKPLKAEYIDKGLVRFEPREVYFDRYGLWAAMMARCGGELRYFGISDILYSTQRDWAASDDPNVVVANLKKIGLTAGMDGAVLDACMKDGAMAEALVAHFEKNFKADGVEGTPTLFINGTKHSNMSYADLKVIIDAELAK
jgi:protein-disulfide isomerase